MSKDMGTAGQRAKTADAVQQEFVADGAAEAGCGQCEDERGGLGGESLHGGSFRELVLPAWDFGRPPLGRA